MALGTIIAGDLNVHHRPWLRFSQRDSTEGQQLQDVSQDCCFSQLVQQPTRGENLLDLVLSDIEAKCKVVPKIADHSGVLVTVDLDTPQTRRHSRLVWHYNKADWDALRDALDENTWDCIACCSTDDGAEHLQARILEAAEDWIPRKKQYIVSKSHGWLTDEVVRLVHAKKDAEGTDRERDAAIACSEAITAEFVKYTERSKAEMLKLPRGSKAWWRKARTLALRGRGITGISSLREGTSWKHSGVEKAGLFADVFKGKFFIPAIEENEYSEVIAVMGDEHAPLGDASEELAAQILKEINPDSATGPDLLPGRILRECACQLAKPLSMLVKRIIAMGNWPNAWREHWIIPIHKKKAVTDARNYRGVHLTAQISKAAERMVTALAAPVLQSPLRIGSNQFAYCKEKGSRDALAYLVLSIISSFEQRQKVVLFCSDVQGAFDRVSEERFAYKVAKAGLPDALIPVFISWMQRRRAKVVCDGAQSDSLELRDMVFQGTVWGPPLWNLFFGDSERPVHKTGFEPIVYADDLNAIKVLDSDIENEQALLEGRRCQEELHRWGRANGVSFDLGKESLELT